MTDKQTEILERARTLLAEMNVGHQVPTMRINTQFAKYKTFAGHRLQKSGEYRTCPRARTDP